MLVVDVPCGRDVPLIGALVTNKIKIEAAGAAATIESLRSGTRMRISFCRVADGDVRNFRRALRDQEGLILPAPCLRAIPTSPAGIHTKVA